MTRLRSVSAKPPVFLFRGREVEEAKKVKGKKKELTASSSSSFPFSQLLFSLYIITLITSPSPLLASICLIVLDTHAASWSMTNSAPSEETSVTGALVPIDAIFLMQSVSLAPAFSR